VNLTDAKIDGSLECNGGQFIGTDTAPALDANGVDVKGAVLLRTGFRAVGRINFTGASVGRAFQWADVGSPENVVLDLRLMKVGTLLNHQNSWPAQGHLELDGFVYDQIDNEAHPNAKVQLGWLELQPRDRFRSQPFEQLAAALRKTGVEDEAKKVMIARNTAEAEHIPLRFNRIGDWSWFKIVGPVIGYGYRPWNAFTVSLAVITVGWWLFRRGFVRGLVTPTKDEKYTIEKDGASPVSDNYPKFNALVYSLETFVPFLKLGINEHWTPNAKSGEPLKVLSIGALRLSTTTGALLRGYLWFHIIAGWVLTTLWVGGLTGLVKT
jgi:hypothetical protein